MEMKTPLSLASALPGSRRAIGILQELGYSEQSLGYKLWNRMLLRANEIVRRVDAAESSSVGPIGFGVLHHRMLFDDAHKAQIFSTTWRYLLPESVILMSEVPLVNMEGYEFSLTQSSAMGHRDITEAVCSLLVWADRLDGEHVLSAVECEGLSWGCEPVPKNRSKDTFRSERYRLRCAESSQVKQGVEELWPWLRGFRCQAVHFLGSPNVLSTPTAERGQSHLLAEFELNQSSPSLPVLRQLLESASSLAQWACTLNHSHRFTGRPLSESAT
jgi:hypothetical protein